MRTKTHVIAIRVTFDKPVSKAAATRAVKESIGQRDYHACIAEEERDGWSTMTARSCFAVANA